MRLLLTWTASLWLLSVFACSGVQRDSSEATQGDDPPVRRPAQSAEMSKIDAALLLVLQDGSRMEALRNRQTSAAARAHLPFVVEEAPDGKLVAPVFVRTARVEETSKAIPTLGGTVSTVIGDVVVARVPMERIVELARRGEVQRIEASHKSAPLRRR